MYQLHFVKLLMMPILVYNLPTSGSIMKADGCFNYITPIVSPNNVTKVVSTNVRTQALVDPGSLLPDYDYHLYYSATTLIVWVA